MKFLSKFTQLRIRHLAWACLLLIVPFSCSNPLSFEKVEDPAEFSFSSFEDSCRMIIIGQVLDARNLKPIPGAAIQLYDQGAISAANGMYRIEIEDVFSPIDIEQLLWAFMPGYELVTYQFTPTAWIDENDCEGSTSYICVDLVMSPKKNMFTIQPDESMKFQFMDTTLYEIADLEGGGQYDTIITTIEVFIPAGAVDVPTSVCLSTYARSSYLGSLPENDLKHLPIMRFRISSEPMINLNQPFTVTFKSDHPVLFASTDSMILYRMNDVEIPFQGYDLFTNRWRKSSDAQVRFNNLADQIQVRSTKLGSYMVMNESYVLTYKEDFTPGDISSSIINLDNCNCAEPKYIDFNVRIDGQFSYNLQNAGALTLLSRLIYLNDFKILTNTPFASLTKLQKLAGSSLYNLFYPDGEKVFKETALLPKCRQLYITSRDINHTVGGFQYDRQFGLDHIIGVQLFHNTSTCPVTSACHQGCPGSE